MRRLRRRNLAKSLVKAPIRAQWQMVSQIFSPTLVVRIFPGPPVTSSLVYARVRYELTGQRQWIVPSILKPPY